MDETVARVPLTDAVHDRLLEMIMDGSLAPGAPLRVQALAARLGVSQTPIRESLGRLAGSQLVVRAPMRGYAVAPLLSDKEVVELMQMRGCSSNRRSPPRPQAQRGSTTPFGRT